MCTTFSCPKHQYININSFIFDHFRSSRELWTILLGRSALREPVSTMHLSIRYSPFRQVSRGKSTLDDLYGNIYYRYVTFWWFNGFLRYPLCRSNACQRWIQWEFILPWRDWCSSTLVLRSVRLSHLLNSAASRSGSLRPTFASLLYPCWISP